MRSLGVYKAASSPTSARLSGEISGRAAQANVCRLIDDTHTASRQFLSRTRSVRPLNSKGVLPLDAHVTDTRKPKSTRATTPGHQANTVHPARKTQHM